MSWLRGVAGIPIRQLHNLRNALGGRPVTVPPLGSATLDRDDVNIARDWQHRRQDWYRGEVAARFEQDFAQWNGSKHAFSFMGGRVALSACIHALGLSPGDEVILPGYTCVVVPNAFRYAGVNVAYGDIELETYGLDVGSVRSLLTASTRAIMVQHLYGLVSRDYEAVLDLARERNLYVIEDCCHATGAELDGIKVGNRGHVAFYSSEQSKVFNTILGGVAVTNDDGVAEGLASFQATAAFPDERLINQLLENVSLNYDLFKHPQRWWRGDVAWIRKGRRQLISTSTDECAGIKPRHYGRRMPDPVAALGINQLKKIDAYNERRRGGARHWDAWCDETGHGKPLVIDGSQPVYLRYPVLVDPRQKRDTRWARRQLGVSLGVWFVTQLHPAVRTVDGCPNAREAVRRCVNFPSVLQ